MDAAVEAIARCASLAQRAADARGEGGGGAARESGRIVLVGITGPVGAGKSTLAARLAGGALSGAGGAVGGAGAAGVLSTDHYLPDYASTPEHLRDLPESSDLARLARDLTMLRRGEPALVPVWCFHEHRRIGEREVRPVAEGGGGVFEGVGGVILEGLHALHPGHAHLLHVRVYVEASSAVRLARWERLALTGQRGWDAVTTRRFFETVAEPTFARHAAAYRQSADVIVLNDVPPSLVPSPSPTTPGAA